MSYSRLGTGDAYINVNYALVMLIAEPDDRTAPINVGSPVIGQRLQLLRYGYGFTGRRRGCVAITRTCR